MLLRRRPTLLATTDELLQEAKARAALPQVIPAPAGHALPSAPLDLDPEIAAVLQRQLRRPGDITTILEERDRFEVYRLIEATDEDWKVLATVFPKVDFEKWFAKQQRLK